MQTSHEVVSESGKRLVKRNQDFPTQELGSTQKNERNSSFFAAERRERKDASLQNQSQRKPWKNLN